MARLFVGNLSYSVDSKRLLEIFSAAGSVVSAEVVSDRFSGRSRGFGFVEMSTEEETQKAVQTLNGQDVDGRKLVVNIARPREDRGGEDRGGGQAPAQGSQPATPADDQQSQTSGGVYPEEPEKEEEQQG